jgi:hypothetical protein
MNPVNRGILACACVAFLGEVRAESPTEMSVQIRSAHLRATPSYLGAKVATTEYADKVILLQSEGEWRQVKSTRTGEEGWVHLSALRTKAIVVKTDAQDASVTASGEEMSLAGKGFNSKVESDFRSKNAEIDFGPIDRMQEKTIPTEDMIRFLDEGEIRPLGGKS